MNRSVLAHWNRCQGLAPRENWLDARLRWTLSRKDYQMKVFLSVGDAYNSQLDNAVVKLKETLKQFGCEYVIATTSDRPLNEVRRLLRSVDCVVVVAFTRFAVAEGTEKPGADDQAVINGRRLPTTWNQIEGAMGFALSLPTLVVSDDNLYTEGILRNELPDVELARIDLKSESLTSDLERILIPWIAKHKVSRTDSLSQDYLSGRDVIETLRSRPGVSVFDLWQHFEDRADNLADRLWTIGAWLMGLIAAVLALPFVSRVVRLDTTASGLTFFGIDTQIVVDSKLILGLIACFGLLVCIYSYFALRDVKQHIEGNWKRTSYILTNKYESGWGGRKSRGYNALLVSVGLAFSAFSIMLLVASYPLLEAAMQFLAGLVP